MNKSICSIEDYKKEELYELAFYDQVTGLTNEKYFYKYLKKKIEKTNNRGKFAILYLKIQNLDKLNNMIGYKSLNNLINKIYKIVSESITKYDIISIYRGEQFFVLFSIEEADKLYSIIDKKINYLVDSLKSYILKSGYNYLLNVNIGLSIYPLHSENAEDLISKAHHAMTLVDINKYDYKIYNKESFINKLDRESIKKDLEKAMKRKELFLNFQPKVRTDNKNIVSVEALIRWKHPQKGDISSGKFIPMAEKSGFIKKIGVWVLNESYKKIENWIKLGYEKISISVNISSIELNDPKILKQIENISKKYSLPNNLIEFEITERTFTEVPENVLNRLKELGFLISLDDFGTGYSSLSYFKKFPIDKLKIDKIFIDSIDEWKTKTLVETVVDVSHKFGLEVVAEGVENKQQLDILKKLKCDYIQGYYFYKPMSDKELEDLLVE